MALILSLVAFWERRCYQHYITESQQSGATCPGSQLEKGRTGTGVQIRPTPEKVLRTCLVASVTQQIKAKALSQVGERGQGKLTPTTPATVPACQHQQQVRKGGRIRGEADVPKGELKVSETVPSTWGGGQSPFLSCVCPLSRPASAAGVEQVSGHSRAPDLRVHLSPTDSSD